MNRILIIGAGLSGAVIARELATQGYNSLVIDKNDHIAGQCYTYREEESGVMVHAYGPHVFNTNNPIVWEYIQQFDQFYPFVNRVKASNCKGVFSFPVNLHTINQLFNLSLTPVEAQIFLDKIRRKDITEPHNAEEKILSLIGDELYELFFKGYTLKQWGISAQELPESIVKRIPVRYNYDDNYYNSRYQGIPMSGYTELINRILDHELIEVKTGLTFDHNMIDDFSHVFYSGALDEFFNYAQGRLSYRTVDFAKNISWGDQQGNGVINYTGLDVPYTRVHQHDYFSPWEKHEQSVLITETSRQTTPQDIPYYPIRTQKDRQILKCYSEMIDQTEKISFIGRLGCYRYLDMQEVIWEALEYSKYWIQWKKCGGDFNKTSASLMID